MPTSWLAIQGILRSANLVLEKLHGAMPDAPLYQKAKDNVGVAQRAVEKLIIEDHQTLKELSESSLEYQVLVDELQALVEPITEEQQRRADQINQQNK